MLGNIIKESELTKDVYQLGEIAKMLQVTPATLRLWEKTEKVKFERSEKNLRTLSKTSLVQLLKDNSLYYNDYSVRESKEGTMQPLKKITLWDDKAVLAIIREKGLKDVNEKTEIPIPTLKNYLYNRVYVGDMPVSKRLKFNIYTEEGLNYKE
jgi:hypothetical protein